MADIVRTLLRKVREGVDELIRRAQLGRRREGIGIEAAANMLAARVLPERGLIGIMSPEIHPHFDIVSDIAAEIPWEVFEEEYFRCSRPECQLGSAPLLKNEAPSDRMHCPRCGDPMPLAGGKLAIERHLTHLVRGGQCRLSQGDEFLIVEDPTQDLCRPEVDPGGICAQHLVALQDLLGQHGYRINLLKGPNATHDRVVRALRNPALVGVYYFGHGFFSHATDQGCLVLADEHLHAAQIEELCSGVRFAFLNACEGAAFQKDWSLEKKVRSVGSALARGSVAKSVIAPIFPVVNAQAAQAALEFFREALGGQSCGEALRAVRGCSLERYRRDEPDISWMAYRYFGDPNLTLPEPEKPTRPSGPRGRPAVASLVFNQDDRLVADRFGFDMRGVVHRAAKRRSLQHRQQVTVTDLVAGLLRVGQLTRHIFREMGVDPDAVYRQICNQDEPEQHAAPAAIRPDDAPTEPGRLPVRGKREFHRAVIGLLETAEQRANRRCVAAEEALIAEQDVLESLLAAGQWPVTALATFPPVPSVRRWLAEQRESRGLDANGLVCLERLGFRARQVIEAAHNLAQQRGQTPISNRLVLAALLADPDGYAAAVCRRQGADAKLLSDMFIAATDSEPPVSFPLGPEACERVVLPLLRQAHQLRTTAGLPEIDDRVLFQAYCQIAPETIRQVLRGLDEPLRLDLDAVLAGPGQTPGGSEPSSGHGDPEQQTRDRTRGADPPPADQLERVRMEGLPMDEALQAVLAAASEYAALQGLPRIHSPHLFAALLSDGSGALVRTLQEKEIPVPRLIRVLLSMIPPQERAAAHDVHVEVSATVGQVLTKAVRRAREDGRSRIGERDVLRALFAHDGVVVQALRQLRLGWLLHEPLTDDAVPQPAEEASGRGILAAFAADLTEKLGRGQLQKPVGRYEEIGALMHALIAPDATVPLLVGQAGVGKKAIVEGLADWIRSDLCPGELRERHILEIATPSLMAATRFGSDLEQRLQALFTADRQRTVLFFDRIDCLVNEELPGAVHLWQMAAEHRLLMLGSCPPDSFEKAIEPDPRWSARFRVLHIQPPSAETTCEILRAHRELLELEHQVTISEAAIEAAVALSGQRVSETAWPGKALDALRQACRQVARDQTLRRRVVDEQDIAKTWREAIE